MIPKKIIIYFSVISALFFIYLAVFGMMPFIKNITNNKNNTSYSFININKKNPKWVEGVSNINDSQKNITQKLAYNISNKFISKSSNNIKNISNYSNVNNILNKINIEDLKNPDNISKIASVKDLGISYTLKDINFSVIKDSPNLIIKYWHDYMDSYSVIKDIVSNTSEMENAIDDAFSNNNFNKIDGIYNKIQETLKSLEQIDVPQSLVVFHKNNIIFLKNFLSTINALRNFQEDPIKAYILAQYFPHLIKDWDNIGVFINKYAPKSK